MKKAVSIILSLAILLTCGAVVYTSATSPKISADTARKIAETPKDEKFEVVVWLNVQIPSVEEIERLTREELGEEWWREHFGPAMTIDDVHVYNAVYNRIAKEYETAANQDFVNKSDIPEEDIVYISTMAPMVQLYANAQTIYRLAEMPEVQSISYEGYRQSEDPTAAPTDNGYPAPTEPPTGIQPTYTPHIRPTESYDGYRTRFNNYCSRLGLEIKGFEVLYIHTNSWGSNDWTLVYATTTATENEELYALVGNRVIVKSETEKPYVTGFAIIDGNGTLRDITKVRLSSFSGLEETFNQLGAGKLLGDIDNDNDLTVLDATILQRCDAGIKEFPEQDKIILQKPVEGALTYYSDFNRDGERDILDVTCMLRYLAGMTYPIG